MTQSSTPAPEPVVVEEPVVAPEPIPEPVVVEAVPVVATVIPPDAPGGDKVPEKAEGVLPPERSEGIMATLAKRRSNKTETPVKAAVVVEPPVVAPPVAVEYVEPAKTTDSAHEEWRNGGCRGPNPDVVAAAKTVRDAWVAEGSKRESTEAELSLYVDCYPEKAEFDTLRALEDEIAARTPSLLEHLRKTSPKDVPEGTVDLGEVLFGRGYSTLSASFALRPITGAWTVSTLGPASSKVLEVLLPKATFVVRGRR